MYLEYRDARHLKICVERNGIKFMDFPVKEKFSWYRKIESGKLELFSALLLFWKLHKTKK